MQRIFVYNSVKKELDALDAENKAPALYSTALIVADKLDGDPGARDMAALAKELRAALGEIRALNLQPVKGAPSDELAAARVARGARAPRAQRGSAGVV